MRERSSARAYVGAGTTRAVRLTRRRVLVLAVLGGRRDTAAAAAAAVAAAAAAARIDERVDRVADRRIGVEKVFELARVRRDLLSAAVAARRVGDNLLRGRGNAALEAAAVKSVGGSLHDARLLVEDGGIGAHARRHRLAVPLLQAQLCATRASTINTHWCLVQCCSAYVVCNTLIM